MPRKKKKQEPVNTSQFTNYSEFYKRYFGKDDIARVATILSKLGVFKGIEAEWAAKGVSEYQKKSLRGRTKVAIADRKEDDMLKDIFKNL